jgi:ribonuclease BN (tRNA processing enzyme)
MYLNLFFSIQLFCLLTLSISCSLPHSTEVQSCGKKGVAVQVLGSGGPELQDMRASTSYLVWQDGQARVLVDAGSGSALRFGESGANMSELDLILFSHFHIDHSGDFPGLIFSSWFEERDQPLPIYGPAGNSNFPSTVSFVDELFNNQHGVYRYLSELFVPAEKSSYKLQPHNVNVESTSTVIFRDKHLAAYAAQVIHGSVPALAWRVEIGGKSITFSGDTNGEGTSLTDLAKDTDLFIAHNAIPEGATGVERFLHMPPSVIGQIAAKAQVKQLLLSHRMPRTLGKEKETLTEIKKNYSGSVTFANDLDCFTVL